MTEQASSFIREHGFAAFVAVALGTAFWVASEKVGLVFLDKIETYQAAQIELTTRAIESNNDMSEALREFRHQQTLRNMKADELSATRERLQNETLQLIVGLNTHVEREYVKDKALERYMMNAINQAWSNQGMSPPFPPEAVNIHENNDFGTANTNEE